MVESEFLGERLVGWRDLPKSCLILGLFLLLFGFFSGLFLAAKYMPVRPDQPRLARETLPFGIRIFPEPERKTASAVQLDCLRKPLKTTVVSGQNGENSTEGGKKEQRLLS